MFTILSSLKDDPEAPNFVRGVVDSMTSRVGSGLVYSRRPARADFVSVINHSRTGLDDMFPGGPVAQMLMRQQLNRYANMRGVWDRYAQFWKKSHYVKVLETEEKKGEDVDVVQREFEDPRICALEEQAMLDNQFAAAGSFFRSILASKLVAVCVCTASTRSCVSHPYFAC